MTTRNGYMYFRVTQPERQQTAILINFLLFSNYLILFSKLTLVGVTFDVKKSDCNNSIHFILEIINFTLLLKLYSVELKIA